MNAEERKAPRSRRASDMDAIEREFLWHDRIPIGHITVLAGAPAKGKSTLGYRIAADVGEPTIFVTTEETDTTVWRPRVEAAGMHLAKAAHHREVKFSKDPDDLAHLAELVNMYQARLIVVDPLSNHMRGASIHRDEQVRVLFEPYLEWLRSSGVALVLQMHVLKSVNPKQHPLSAVPAGVVSIAKAVYLFGDDPTIGADPNIRVLACADKFNFGAVPASMEFEYETRPVSVRRDHTSTLVMRDFGLWRLRGESKVSAKLLLVTLAPESKDRKSDRVAFVLVELLRGGPQPVSTVRRAIDDLEPPVSWRTVERVKNEMGIEELDDERDKRRKHWKLPDSVLAVVEEATERDDELIIEEVDIPDAVPEDWTPDDGDGGATDRERRP